MISLVRLVALAVSLVFASTGVATSQQVALAKIEVLKSGKVAAPYGGFPKIAQFIPPPFLTGVSAKVLTFINSEYFPGSGCTSPCTFNLSGAGYGIGPATANRIVIFSVWGSVGGGITVPSATVCGVSATLGPTGTNSLANSRVVFLMSIVPTGTTCVAVVTFSSNPVVMGSAAWYATGVTSATPVGSGSSNACPGGNASAAVTTVAGGFMLGTIATNTTQTTITPGGGLSQTNGFFNQGSSLSHGGSAQSGTSAGTANPSYSGISSPNNCGAAFMSY